MSARQRQERQDRALSEGEQAFWGGVPIEDCPYKVSTWGVGGWWRMGWARGARAAKSQEELRDIAKAFGEKVKRIKRGET